MATVTAPKLQIIEPDQVILPEVSWETYRRLRDAVGNDSIRMIYLDGTLTLMSPALRHDRPSRLLEQLVRGVAAGLGMKLMSIGSATLRRAEVPGGGVGKEPDIAFYLGDDERRMRLREDLDLAADPPPTLAIEIDNTRNSAPALTVYARLGVPEVWRYSVSKRSIWMGRLDGSTYQEVARSVALPKLTPALVREALDRFQVGDFDDNDWFEWVKVWIRALAEN